MARESGGGQIVSDAVEGYAREVQRSLQALLDNPGSMKILAEQVDPMRRDLEDYGAPLPNDDNARMALAVMYVQEQIDRMPDRESADLWLGLLRGWLALHVDVRE